MAVISSLAEMALEEFSLFELDDNLVIDQDVKTNTQDTETDAQEADEISSIFIRS